VRERIRRASPDEAGALTALSRRSKAYWGYPPELMARFVEELVLTADEIREHDVWVLEAGGQTPLGYHHTILGEPAILQELWIEPAAIRAGRGRRLLEHAIAIARDAGASALELDADPNAVPFYERLGGRVIGRTPSTAVAGRTLPRVRIDLV
jgi:GNAT superfamily N-acetyltransferase